MNILSKQSRRSCQGVFVALLLAFFGMSGAHAQDTGASPQVPGAIGGKVLDNNTKQYIKNALVSIVALKREVITDEFGAFYISGLRAGTYVVDITYGDMMPEKRTITVAAGETRTIEVPLSSDILQLEKFVVSGERQGQLKMISEQRNSETAKYVISAEAFGDIQDGNIGEVLKQIPGVMVDEIMGEPTSISIRGGDASSPAIAMMDGNQVASTGRDKSQTGGERGGEAGYGISDGSISLVGFNADNVESIEVAKSASPDMPGSSSGGMINFRTRSAFQQKGRRVTLNTYLNFSESYLNLGPSASNRDNPSRKLFPGYAFSYTESFGRAHPFGISFTAAYNKSLKSTSRYQLSEKRIPDLPTGQDATPDDTTVVSSVRWNSNDFVDYTMRYNLNFDQRITHASIFYINTSYGRNGASDGGFTNVGVEQKSFILREGATRDTLVIEPSGDTTYYANVARTRYNDFNWRVNPGMRHNWGDFKLEYDTYYSYSKSQNNGDDVYYELVGRNSSPDGYGGFVVENANSKGDGQLTQTDGPDIGDLNNYTYLTYSANDSSSVQKRMGGKMDLRRSFLFKYPLQVQAGMRYDRDERSYYNPRKVHYLTGPDARRNTVDDPKLGQFANTARGNYTRWSTLEGKIADWVDVGQVRAFLDEHPEMFLADAGGNMIRELDSRKVYEEAVTGAYGMASIKFGPLNVLAGARYEFTDLTATGNVKNVVYGNVTSDSYIPDTPEREKAKRQVVTGKATYDNWFPSVHLRYELLPRKLQFRASATRTIGRPNITWGVLPFEEVDDVRINDYGTVGRILKSNAKLEPKQTVSYDFDVEYYFDKGGVASIGLYEKTDRGYFAQTSEWVGAGPDNGFDGKYEGYQFVMWRNVGDVRRRGVELSYSQPLRFLPGKLKNLSVSANYTYTNVLMDLFDIYGKVYAQSDECINVVPHIVNGFVSYNGKSLVWQVRGHWEDSFLIERNDRTKISSYRDARLQIDMSMRYKFNSHWALNANVRNVFGAHRITRFMSDMVRWDDQEARNINVSLQMDF